LRLTSGLHVHTSIHTYTDLHTHEHTHTHTHTHTLRKLTSDHEYPTLQYLRPGLIKSTNQISVELNGAPCKCAVQ